MEAKWRLFLVLLLPLAACEVTIVKTIGRGPDVTEICVNTTQSPIILIVCKIRTERSGEVCYLFYQPSKDSVQQNYSRFFLKMENQTVSLHLINLTAVDSGNHTCECSHTEGTEILHLNITVDLNITVEDKNSPPQLQLPVILIGAAVFLIISVVIAGFIYRAALQRRRPKHTEPEDIEPYSTFMRKESGLYSTARINMITTNNSDVPATQQTLSGSV